MGPNPQTGKLASELPIIDNKEVHQVKSIHCTPDGMCIEYALESIDNYLGDSEILENISHIDTGHLYRNEVHIIAVNESRSADLQETNLFTENQNEYLTNSSWY